MLQQFYHLPPLAHLPLQGLDVLLHPLSSLLKVADEVIAVLTVLEVLPQLLHVAQVQLALAKRLAAVVGVVLQGLHDLELGAQLAGLEVLHDLLGGLLARRRRLGFSAAPGSNRGRARPSAAALAAAQQ